MEQKCPTWRKLLFTRATSISLCILTVVLMITAVVAPFVARHQAHRHLTDHGADFYDSSDVPAWASQFGDYYPKSLLKWKQLDCSELKPCSFRAIRYFPEVQLLFLKEVAWFDDECVLLATLPKLRGLGMRGTNTTDAVVVHLAHCTLLEALNLADTPITDASIPSLARLHRLKHLNVTGTKITAAGVRRLQAGLPACEIRSVHRMNEPADPSLPD